MTYTDPSDNLPINENGVGAWIDEKHARLRKYIDITRATRRKYLNKSGATYIDLFCSYGRARLRDGDAIVDGSPLVAWKTAQTGNAPFTCMHIGDTSQEALDTARRRLSALHAPVVTHPGPAESTVHKVAGALDPQGLHFAFLDPYNLDSLPFSVIEALARVKRMDILIHVSTQDLQRNFGIYFNQQPSPLDRFAPDWRNAVDPDAPERTQRRQVLDHWLERIRALDMQPAEGIEQVTADKNQNLYWLVFVSRHPKAHEFWEKIRNTTPQRRLL